MYMFFNKKIKKKNKHKHFDKLFKQYQLRNPMSKMINMIEFPFVVWMTLKIFVRFAVNEKNNKRIIS